MSRSRWGLAAASVVVFLLVAGQILIPSIGERKVEDRLTEGGGTADVTLGAFPAARLLFGDGERFEVDARDLDLGLDRDERVFDRLDGFSIVEVSISDSTAGPFELTDFELNRNGEGPIRSRPTRRRRRPRSSTTASRASTYPAAGSPTSRSISSGSTRTWWSR